MNRSPAVSSSASSTKRIYDYTSEPEFKMAIIADVHSLGGIDDRRDLPVSVPLHNMCTSEISANTTNVNQLSYNNANSTCVNTYNNDQYFASDYEVSMFLNDVIFDDSPSESNQSSHGSQSLLSKRKHYDINTWNDFNAICNGYEGISLATTTCPSFLVTDFTKISGEVPDIITYAFNQNNFQNYHILQSLCHSECVFHITCPRANVTSTGFSIIHSYIQALMSAHTNVVVKPTKTKLVRDKNIVKLIHEYSIRYVRSEGKYYNRFFGFSDDALATDYLIDSNKSDPKDIITWKATERLACDSGRKVLIQVKAVNVELFDINYNSIVKHSSKVRITSLSML